MFWTPPAPTSAGEWETVQNRLGKEEGEEAGQPWTRGGGPEELTGRRRPWRRPGGCLAADGWEEGESCLIPC